MSNKVSRKDAEQAIGMLSRESRQRFCQRLEGHAGRHSSARRDLGAAITVAAGIGAPSMCWAPMPSTESE